MNSTEANCEAAFCSWQTSGNIDCPVLGANIGDTCDS